MAQRHLVSSVITVLVLIFTVPTVFGGDGLGHLGSFDKWARVEIDLPGSYARSDGDPNPFAVEVDVEFTAPGGRVWTIPGFYDGDGQGGPDGDVWRVRFSADEIGAWSFRSRSIDPVLDGFSGTFDVVAAPGDASDFYLWGRLEYRGDTANDERYLKFRDGPFWLKAGCDDPENFLGKFSNYDTHAERIATVDYLADRGVNSMYMMTHNVGGDDQDVWPWLGSGVSEAMSNGASGARFDIPRLHEWLALFEHMQDRGVVPYLILEDDSAWTGFDRPRYYREMIARFGHLPAVLFNIAEEANENYGLSHALDHARTLASEDPYDHPRGIHNVNAPANDYLDEEAVDFTAMQTQHTDALDHNDDTLAWIDAARSRGTRTPMVGFDEPRPLLDRKGWWSAYMGGGVWEVHVVKPYDRPISTWEPAWTEIGGTRKFMESLPFASMQPSNELVASGTAFCLASPGEAYALYLPSGGTVRVDLTAGKTYRYDWWNPANGKDGAFQGGALVDGGSRSFTAPGGGDWALRIVAESGSANSPPVAHHSGAEVQPGAAVSIPLPYTDPDGPGPHSFDIVTQPSQGSLTGTGDTRTYTADPSAAGSDSFVWTVHDGLDVSNQATVTIDIVAPGNVPATAIDQFELAVHDTPLTIHLHYTDPDGPGPHDFRIVDGPSHGTAVQDTPGSNDVIYTPDPGYDGEDSFTWAVHDGIVESNVATATLEVGPQPIFTDGFGRPDAPRVGKRWVERETASRVSVDRGTLQFDPADDAVHPQIYHHLRTQPNGAIEWSFDLGWQRTGAEDDYSFWMQMGDWYGFSADEPRSGGVAVNLVWGGPSAGLDRHEAIGWVLDGVVHEIGVASGATRVTVEADMDARTYTVAFGVHVVENIPFDDDVTTVDAIRYFNHATNAAAFASRFVDNVSIVYRPASVVVPVATISSPADDSIVRTRSKVNFRSDGSIDPDGSVVGWSWSFGDGSMSTAEHPTHRYDRSGTYTVTLVVQDDHGNESTPATITVHASSPSGHGGDGTLAGGGSENPDIGSYGPGGGMNLDPGGL